jgi:hypothetical protein
MDGVLGFLLVAVPLFFVVRHFTKKSKTRAEFAALPVDGPMQVNVTEENFPASGINSKNVKCLLKIDVKISQNDWRAIANAGLMKKLIFQYPSSAAADQYDPENMFDFRVEDLKRSGGVTFGDVIQMQDAKEKLVEALYDLREHIDQQRYGAKTERLRI